MRGEWCGSGVGVGPLFETLDGNCLGRVSGCPDCEQSAPGQLLGIQKKKSTLFNFVQLCLLGFSLCFYFV